MRVRVLTPYRATTTSYLQVNIGSCPECESKGPFTINVEQTIYRNYQKLTLQESRGVVSAGRFPRFKKLILLNQRMKCDTPNIDLTGYYEKRTFSSFTGGQ